MALNNFQKWLIGIVLSVMTICSVWGVALYQTEIRKKESLEERLSFVEKRLEAMEAKIDIILETTIKNKE